MGDETGWGRWYLAERCGVDPEDREAVRDYYETARGWYYATSRRREHYLSLVDAITCAYGVFPPDWSAPTLVLMARPLRNLLPRKPQAG